MTNLKKNLIRFICPVADSGCIKNGQKGKCFSKRTGSLGAKAFAQDSFPVYLMSLNWHHSCFIYKGQ
jgi:hypothetical protein